MKKKELPLEIIRLIQSLSEIVKDLDDVIIEKHENCLLLIKDRDIESDFHFTIHSCEVKNVKLFSTISYKPSSTKNPKEYSATISASAIKPSLERWLSLIREYNLPYPLFDDPIIQSYLKDLEPDFEIIDADANQAPYNFDKQLHINNVYNKLIELVLKEKTNENQEEAEHIISLIEANKKEISKQTKKQVVENLKRVVAHCFKYSFEVGKSIVADVIVEIGKRLLTGG